MRVNFDYKMRETSSRRLLSRPLAGASPLNLGAVTPTPTPATPEGPGLQSRADEAEGVGLAITRGSYRVTLDYDQLAETIGRVLTTGPDRLARLAAIEDPWEPSVARALPSPRFPRVTATAETVEVPPPPTRQPHPIFDHIDAVPPEEALGAWISRLQREARAPFQPWDEIMARITRCDFHTQQALAVTYNKPEKWARDLRKVAVSQGVITEAAWWACFPKKKGKSTYDPQLTAHRSAGTPPQLARESLETVMQAQRKLDFDTVIQMIRFRCWATVHDFGEHFRQPPAWAASLRAYVIREGLFTVESWSKCFGKDKRQLVSK